MTDIEAQIPRRPKFEEDLEVDPQCSERDELDEIENEVGGEEHHRKFKLSRLWGKSEDGSHNVDHHHFFDVHFAHLPHVHLDEWRHHHFHLWSGHKLPHRSSSAHELARAEAASWAQMTPLIAATLGPLAVLLGIANLAQRWHGLILDPSNGDGNYTELPDPKVNVILGAITLVCEVLGNFFLVLRFSNFHSKFMTWASYIFWITKVIFGIANCIQFGIAHPETDDIIYLQGYWAGICSMAVTAIILVALTFNLTFLHGQDKTETRRLHHVQREFMVQTLIFFIFVGICGLAFCRAEGVTFIDGIYLMVVTTLTIGFGDITPHTTIMKIFIFPFAVIGLSLLAVIVTSIVQLLSDRTRRKRLQMAKRLKEKQSEKKRLFSALPKLPRIGTSMKLTTVNDVDKQKKRDLSLHEALYELREEEWKRERRANLRSMATGLAVFFAFWFSGALIFHFVQGWGYGDALYFCYIFFLTIGYGDFFPTAEAGRPIFIVYALLAVPTMTIIVQTVTSNFSAYTMERVHRQRHQVYKENDFEIRSLNSLVKDAKQRACESIMEENPDDNPVELPLHHVTERLMERLQQMHHQLQNLLMQKLGSDARHVIAAERARQASNECAPIKAMEKEDDINALGKAYIAKHLNQIGQEHGTDELKLLNEYRERYASILAELMIAKDKLIKLEKGLRNRAPEGEWRTRINEELKELGDFNFDEKKATRRSRRSSEW